MQRSKRWLAVRIVERIERKAEFDREGHARSMRAHIEGSKMKKLALAAVAMAAGVVLGAGGVTIANENFVAWKANAATGPAIYNVYEASVKDVGAYEKDLSAASNLIKESGGERIAGGFDKSKATRGAPVANRFVIIRWPDMASYEKGQKMGIKEWVDNHAPDAREIITEAVEGK
jgi:hypothetical protein